MTDHPVRVAWTAGSHPGISQAEEEFFVYAASDVADITARNLDRVTFVLLKTDAGVLLYRADDTSIAPEDGFNVILDSNDRPFVLDAVPPFGMAGANLVVNGSTEVSQQNGAAAVAATDAYPVDQWQLSHSGWSTATFSAQQVSDAPPGYAKSLKLTVTAAEAAPGSAAFVVLHQKIEGYRAAKIGLGGSAALPCVVGFWIKCSVAGTYAVSLKNSANDQCFLGTVTVAQAATWEWKTVTVSARTAGTWLGGTSIGLRLAICPACGSSFKGAAGWSTSNLFGVTGQTNLAATLNATLQMTGVVLLPGSYVPLAAQAQLLMRSYAEELMVHCWRYFIAFFAAGSAYDAFGMGQSFSATGGVYIVNMPVEMRAPPTLAFSAANTFVCTNGTDGAVAITAIAANVIGNKTFRVQATVASGLTAGQGSTLFRDSTDAAYIHASARM